MSKELKDFVESMQRSHAGGDYADSSFKPVDSWSSVKGIDESPKKANIKKKLKVKKPQSL